MKILRVGDPHVRPSNIDESDRLMEFVSDLAIKQNVDRIELLGDLFHTHAILRLEVIEFWNNWLDHLSDICETVVIVGNHDMSGDHNDGNSALTVFQRIKKKNLRIVENAQIIGPFGYVPYIHDNAKFAEIAHGLLAQGVRVLVCHATFDGSKFENGFFAPGGAAVIHEFTHIISGHIHAQQEFANVLYPGTPRWDTASDANQPKGVWIFEHGAAGEITKRDFYSTETVCAPIIARVWREGEPEPVLPENARVSLELVGSSDFVAKAKAKLKGKVSIKAKITDSAKAENRKSGKGITDFLLNHYAGTTIPKEKLLKYMEENKLV